MIRTKLSTLALAAVLTLPLATAGCSQGSSPTEPAFDDELASASSLSSVTEESRGRGGDDNNDDNSADDNDNHRRRRGRGGDDDRNDDNNRRRGRGGRGDRGDRGDRGGRGGNDDGNRPARNGQEFEGAVASVGGGSVTLVNGLRIVVNGATQWSGRGDLFSLSEIQDSLADGNDPRVEGRGTRQGDGSILAQTLKAEHVGD
ncbi:MAG: hypothetical protein ACLGI9_10480 [Thermoanaerobaculia bacterium]